MAINFENNNKAVVAMSGGVDSSVAAYLMKEHGYETSGVTFKLYDENIEDDDGKSCCSDKDIEDARRVSEIIGINYNVINFEDDFRKEVIDRFVNGYLCGETPNPCIECNRYIKFKRMMSYADETDSRYISTGHYARVSFDSASGRYLLKKGKYDGKDQSYVLYSLDQSRLSRLILPVGELKKSEVREIAEKCGFCNSAKPDSQDICFVKDGNYVSFIENYCKKKFPPGDFVDTHGKVIAKHKGIIGYTIGQRRGLGIASTESYFVVDKDVENNRVIIGRENEQYRKSLTAKDLNFIAFEKLDSPIRVKSKIRYKHKEVMSTVTPIDENRVIVEFDEPQRAVTKGQSVVFYDGEYVVGGGKIE